MPNRNLSSTKIRKEENTGKLEMKFLACGGWRKFVSPMFLFI